ncbi:MAG: DUF1573 domain-containing protein [Lentisphaeria bacterium]|nr:DUF1573 domain-containing protein [Lentisphaeria bacterium]
MHRVWGLVWAVCAALCVSRLVADPVLLLEPATYEWGRQAENKEVYEFSFKIANEGDSELEITNVRPGCGCTKVDLKKSKLAPGESTQMTGTLRTTGVEGKMNKGIILTTNDPKRKTAIAGLDIRFPFNCQGLRMKYTTYGARQQQDSLQVYVYMENCEAEAAIQIKAVELPEGWDCPDTLPLAVAAEDKQTLRLVRQLAPGTVPEPFDALAFKVLTDSDKTPEVTGSISYRPRVAASTRVTQENANEGEARPAVRWPLTTPLVPAAATAGETAEGNP